MGTAKSIPKIPPILALFIVVQQLESHVIIPVVMRKAVGLSPLIVVLALLKLVSIAVQVQMLPLRPLPIQPMLRQRG